MKTWKQVTEAAWTTFNLNNNKCPKCLEFKSDWGCGCEAELVGTTLGVEADLMAACANKENA